MPKDFIHDGTVFINRCAKPDKREFISASQSWPYLLPPPLTNAAEISQAVGVGFIIMGVIGYVVKLVHIPVNNILVGGS